MELALAILASSLGAATPLLLAAMGELVVERAGVMNLGVEGMMLTGASVGFGVAATTGDPALGALAGMLAGMVTSLVFGFLVLTCLANQVATGLALTVFGIGASASIGSAFTSAVFIPGEAGLVSAVSGVPFLGAILTALEPMTCLALAIGGLVAWMLSRTRLGMVIRAVGDAPESAHVLGFNVKLIRYGAVLFGGAMAGLAGAFLSVIYTPQWIENMTAGRGWIAISLVVFAAWRPLYVMAGACLFGGLTILQFHAQGIGVGIPSQFLSMLPYVATIIVLVVISRDRLRTALNTPASLGRSFHPDA